MINRLMLAMLAFSMVSCGYYNEVYDQPGTGGQFKADATLGFEVIQTIFARNKCLDCHSVARGNRGGINLETYSSTQPVAGLVNSDVQSDIMPLGGPSVSAQDKAILAAWVAAGAPETSQLPLPSSGGEETGTTNPSQPTPQPTGVDFTVVRQQIFQPYCVQCHGSMAQYTGVAGRLPQILEAVTSDRMPKGGPALSAELKTMLAEWIDAGAPETLN